MKAVRKHSIIRRRTDRENSGNMLKIEAGLWPEQQVNPGFNHFNLNKLTGKVRTDLE